MQIVVTDVVNETNILIIFLITCIIVSIKKRSEKEIFPIFITNELKGFAILAVIFSHLGYFLFADNRFTYPMSTIGGVAVNIFLFLSGYGLTISQQKNKLSIKNFYLKRLVRIFVPMWISLLFILLLDFFILNKTYPIGSLLQNIAGYVPSNDLFLDINSPLWYFTLIVFYYLIFPILFKNKYPILSAIAILLISIILVKLPIPVNEHVLRDYKVHIFAFPLGMIFSILLSKFESNTKISQIVYKYCGSIIIKLGRYIALVPLMLIVGYYAIYSGVGQRVLIEESISLVTVAFVILIFLIKPFKIQFLELLGIFSFEIYLLHWPIFSRYPILYNYIPASLATIVYIALTLLLSVALQRFIDFIFKRFGDYKKIEFVKNK